MDAILNLVSQYGYILVFVLLAIELMGVPFLPGEILVVYCGFLVYQGKLNFILLLITVILGVITGLTSSYFVGKKLGAPFFKKHGAKIHLGPDKMDKISKLINKYGSVLIMFICFIPGLKHIIGYFSGASSMRFKKYAIGGYLGAVLWGITFVSIGDLLGSNWALFHKYIIKYLVVGAILVVVVIGIFYVLKIYKDKIIEFIKKSVLKLLKIFHSLGKIRIFVLATAVVCILLVDAFVNIVQGLLSNQFSPFNEITYYIIQRLFSKYGLYSIVFKTTSIIESNIMYIIVPILLIIYLWYKSKNRIIEIKYTLITICGGFIIEYILLYIFKLISMYVPIFNNIFNLNCYNVAVVFGFLFYILVKAAKRKIVNRGLIVLFIFICVLSGIAQLFFGNTLSEILAGFSLGGTWLTLNIILLEVSKVLPNTK